MRKRSKKPMKPDKVIPRLCSGYKFPPKKGKVSTKEGIIYALSIGFSKDPMKLNDLKFTHEANKNFQLFPTIGTAYPWCQVYKRFQYCPGLPSFSPAMVHCE